MKVQVEMSRKEKAAYALVAMVALAVAMVYINSIYHPVTRAVKAAECVMTTATQPVKTAEVAQTARATAIAKPAKHKSFDGLTDNLPGQYKVKPNDTAYSIAKKNGIKAEQLYAMNGMSYGSTIYPGQMLDVPK